MKLKARQIWRTYNRHFVGIFEERSDGLFVVGPLSGSQRFTDQPTRTYLVDDRGEMVDPNGEELELEDSEFSLDEYIGQKI